MFLKTHWTGSGLGMHSIRVSYPLACPFCRSLDTKTACRAIQSLFPSNGFCGTPQIGPFSPPISPLCPFPALAIRLPPKPARLLAKLPSLRKTLLTSSYDPKTPSSDPYQYYSAPSGTYAPFPRSGPSVFLSLHPRGCFSMRARRFVTIPVR